MKILNRFKFTFVVKFLFFICCIIFVTEAAVGQIDNLKVITQAYVINRDGAEIKKQPDSYAEQGSYAKFGEILEVTKIYNFWYAVKINTPERIGYIKRTDVTNNETHIPLTKADLLEPYEESRISSDLPTPNIDFTLITKDQFYAIKQTAINYFVADTDKIKKNKRTIKLPIKKGFRIFTDRPDYDKIDWNSYGYIGQYPILNKYLIYNSDGAAESGGYYFVDKTTGKSEGISEAFPYLSADKTTTISINANISNNYTELSISKINKKGIKTYAYGEFKNWMPVETGDQFWGNDNCFYLPVLPSMAYYPSHGDKKPLGYNYRYIRVKIKGHTARF